MKVTIKILLTAVLAALISTAAFAVPMAVETADSATEVENIEQVATGELAAAYGDLTYSISGGEVTITDCNSSATSVVIPETIEGYPVTIIGKSAFSGCQSLTNIEIPDSVTSIGDKAFYLCTSLTSIEIPDSVTSIGNSAFYNCYSLTSITVDENNAEYSSDVFGVLYNKDKTTLIQYPIGNKRTSFEIPGGVTSIGDSAFRTCTSLTSIEIPDSVTSIGNSAFYNCTSLTSIEIPDSVTSIGYSAFLFCESLTSIEIPDSVTNIGFNAFQYCESLESATIYSKDVVFGDLGVFDYCDILTLYGYSGSTTETYAKDNDIPFIALDKEPEVIASGTCGDNLTWTLYEYNALVIEGTGDMYNWSSSSVPWSSYRSSIKNVVIENGVTSIGNYAFYDCTSLTSIEIPNGVTSIGDSAFYFCESLKSIEIPDSVTNIGYSAFNNCRSFISIEIPDSVKIIGDWAFGFCYSLEIATIYSKDVVFGGSSVFYDCYYLALCGYSGSTTKTYAKDNDIPFIALEGKVIVSGTCGDNLTWSLYEEGTLVIEGTGDMWDWTYSSPAPWYSNSTSIKNVIIEDSATSIGNLAFNNCKSLESIEIPDSVTNIGTYAFSKCTSLASIEIPDSVTSIGGSAFEYCTSLASITVDENNENYSNDESGVLFNKDKTTLIQYPIGNTATSYVIPDSVTSIGNYAFSWCDSLTSVEIPDSITSIGSRAFYYCSSLESVTIPDSVTSIGDYAFSECSSLGSATIYSRNASFGSDVFTGCSNLTLYGYAGSTTETYAEENVIPFVALKEEPDHGEVIATGECGDNLIWTLDDEGVLTIRGTGYMTSWGYWTSVPWYFSRENIKKVVIEDGVTSIGDFAFDNCTSLASVEIPGSVTSIGWCAFHSCDSLASVEIGSGVTSIGGCAFSSCSSLASVEIPNSVTSIGNDAFFNCSSLASVEIPNSVTFIDFYAFYGCTSLESIEIPDSVTSIGERAFYNCTSLAKATIYSRNASFGSDVFTGCSNLTLYGYSGSTTETYAEENDIPFVALKEEVIIDLGTRDDESNIRYVEIGGIQTKIDENNDKSFIEIGEENLLVEIVEKTAEGAFVKSRYYYVDVESKTATKLNMDSYVTTDGKKSIRINNPMGMRFRSVITTASKNEETDFVIDEYGFIVATEDALGDTELNFDFTKYVTGVAYNKESGIDIVFDESDECHTFTGYVKNIPVANYKTNLVCKTYTKLTVGGKQFTLYGEAVVGNIYDTAKALVEDETLAEETKNELYKIILDYENTIGILGDNLYPKE